MKYQKTNYTCGPAALSNALRYFGIAIEEEEIKPKTKTDKEGTDDYDLMAGIKKLGFIPKEISTKKPGEAYALLTTILKTNPVILAVDEDEHYVAAIGLAGGRPICFDSDGEDKEVRKEMGVLVYSEEDLLERWKNKEGEFYGIVIYRSMKKPNIDLE